MTEAVARLFQRTLELSRGRTASAARSRVQAGHQVWEGCFEASRTVKLGWHSSVASLWVITKRYQEGAVLPPGARAPDEDLSPQLMERRAILVIPILQSPSPFPILSTSIGG